MNEPQSLQQLVDLASAKRQASGRQLGNLAQQHGFRITFTTINAIRQGTYKSVPTTETIRAIAWLAGVSEEAAFTAAGQPVPGPPFADELPPGVDLLPPKARRAAIEMLRVLVDLNKDATHAQDDSTTHPADSAVPPMSNPTLQTGQSQEAADELEQQRAARRRPGAGQKTDPPAHQPADEDDGALPPNWQDLAAYSGPTAHLDRERHFDEIGEERQEADAD